MAATSTIDNKIRRQLEYYFGDFNLMRDQFLKNEIKLSNDANNEGYVPLDVMLKCNRLSQLSTDKEKIVNAISSSKLLQVKEDGSAVRRNPERKLPVDDEIYRLSLKSRTCFVSGLPRDEHAKGEISPANIDEVYNYMEELGVEVETVNLRRNKNPKDSTHGLFNGSMFVTFASQADASKFLESDVKFREKYDLKKMTKQAYWTMENTRKKTIKAGGDVEAAVASAKAELEKEKNPVFEDGIVVCFSDVKDATIRREDIKDFLVENGAAVDFIDFESGKDSGIVLLNLKEGKAPKDIFGEELTRNIKGEDIKFSIGSEKDFEVIAAAFAAFKKQIAEKKKNDRMGKNKKGRNQRNKGGNRKQKQQNTKKTFDSDDEGEKKDSLEKSDEPPAKVAKTEEATS